MNAPSSTRASRANSLNLIHPVFGILIAVIFWSFAAAANESVINTVSATVTFFVTIYCLMNAMSRGIFCVSLLTTGALFLNFALSTGWLIANFIHLFTLKYSIDYTLEAMSITAGEYAFGVVFAGIFALAMSLLSLAPVITRLESRVLQTIIKLRKYPLNTIITWVSVITIFDIVLILTGVVRQKSINTGSELGHVAFYMPFLTMAFNVQIPLNSLIISKIDSNFRFISNRFFILILSVLSSLFIFFSQGRTGFVFCIMAHLAWFSLFKGRLPKFRSFVIALIIGLPIFYNVILANNIARTMRHDSRSGTSVSSLDAVITSATAMKDTSVRQQQALKTAQNLSSRPLVATPLAISMQQSRHDWQFLGGQYLVNSSLWTVPRVIFPDKVDVANAEDLLSSQGILQRSTDVSDSLYFGSYVDFGWFGTILYPIVIALLWIFILWMCGMQGPIFCLIALSACTAIFTVGMGETAVTELILTPRNILILFLLMPALTLLTSSLKGGRAASIGSRLRRRTASPPR